MPNLETKTKQKSAKPVHIQRRTRNRQNASVKSPQAILQRAQADPQSLRSEDILQLQRTLGNKATATVLQRTLNYPEGTIQRGPRWDAFKSSASKFGKTAFNRMFGMSRVTDGGGHGGRTMKPRGQFSTAKAQAKSVIAQYHARKKMEEKATIAFQHHTDEMKMGYDSRKPSENVEETESDKIKLSDLYHNELAWAFMAKQAKREFSSENAMFLDFVRRANPSERDESSGKTVEERIGIVRPLMEREAYAIFKSFIETGSTYSINIASATRKELTLRILGGNREKKKRRGRKNDNQSQELGEYVEPIRPGGTDYVSLDVLDWFDRAASEIEKMIISDTLSRFQTSPEGHYARRALRRNQDLAHWAGRYRLDMDSRYNKKQTWKQFLFW